ncbi:MAG: hypothetical protein PHE24_05395 [Patescibacteria group bacterium]|nr:hypothetical protein [Patescibacteria group bacterium]
MKKKLKDLNAGDYFIYAAPHDKSTEHIPVSLLQLVIIEPKSLDEPLPWPKGIREQGMVRNLRAELLEEEVIIILPS